jgi:hypothetical protein
MDKALIAGLAGAVANVGGTLATGQMNEAQMKYNDLQYQRQRKDALADWTMQNQYNSPAAQMARYKDAGLNPNLIYGNMTTSPAVRSSDLPNAKLAPMNYTGAIAEGLQSYQDTALKTAQTDNLKKQNDVLTQDILLKTADVLGKKYSNEKMRFEIDKQPELFQTTLDGIKANTRKALMDTLSTESATTRAEQLQPGVLKQQSQTLTNAIQDLANKKSLNALTQVQRREVLERVKTIKNSGILQKLDIELKKKGIQPSDSPFMRIPAQLMSAPDVQKELKLIWNKIKRRY